MSCLSPATCVCQNAFGPDGSAPVGVIEAQVVGVLEDGAQRARVEALHGHVTGVMVGDHFALHSRHLVGTVTTDEPHIFVAVFQLDGASPVVPIADGGAVERGYAAVALEDGVVSTCRQRNVGALPPLSRDQVANAILAVDCARALWAIDERWEGGDCPDGLFSCGAAGAHDNLGAPTVAIVFVTLIVTLMSIYRRLFFKPGRRG